MFEAEKDFLLVEEVGGIRKIPFQLSSERIQGQGIDNNPPSALDTEFVYRDDGIPYALKFGEFTCRAYSRSRDVKVDFASEFKRLRSGRVVDRSDIHELYKLMYNRYYGDLSEDKINAFHDLNELDGGFDDDYEPKEMEDILENDAWSMVGEWVEKSGKQRVLTIHEIDLEIGDQTVEIRRYIIGGGDQVKMDWSSDLAIAEAVAIAKKGLNFELPTTILMFSLMDALEYEGDGYYKDQWSWKHSHDGVAYNTAHFLKDGAVGLVAGRARYILDDTSRNQSKNRLIREYEANMGVYIHEVTHALDPTLSDLSVDSQVEGLATAMEYRFDAMYLLSLIRSSIDFNFRPIDAEYLRMLIKGELSEFESEVERYHISGALFSYIAEQCIYLCNSDRRKPLADPFNDFGLNLKGLNVMSNFYRLLTGESYIGKRKLVSSGVRRSIEDSNYEHVGDLLESLTDAIYVNGLATNRTMAKEIAQNIIDGFVEIFNDRCDPNKPIQEQ